MTWPLLMTWPADDVASADDVAPLMTWPLLDDVAPAWMTWQVPWMSGVIAPPEAQVVSAPPNDKWRCATALGRSWVHALFVDRRWVVVRSLVARVQGALVQQTWPLRLIRLSGKRVHAWRGAVFRHLR
jgi:hypothetical protein